MLSTVHRPWLVFTAKALVVLQGLAILYLLSSVWVALGVAAAFFLLVVTIRRVAPH